MRTKKGTRHGRGWIWFSVLAAILLGRGLLGAQNDGDDVVIGKYRVLHSRIFDENRLLVVHLPRGYETDRISYPVLYHLYGDNIPDYFAPALIACDKLGQTGEAPPMIIVGVANTNRYRDNRGFQSDGAAGGAGAFIRFFKEELIPLIDGAYRTKPFRILAGPQAGAHFALYALMTEPGLFDLYVATNPFEGDDRIAGALLGKAEDFFGGAVSLRKMFYMTCEEDAPAPQLERARRLSALIEARKPEGFQFRSEFVKPSGFFITPAPVLEALRAYFSDFRLPGDFRVRSVSDVKSYYEGLSKKYGFSLEAPEFALTMASDRLQEQRKPAEAIELLDYQLSLYPESLDAFWRLGEIHRSLGQYEKALEFYRRFLAIKATDADMVVQRIRGLERYLKDSAACAVEKEIGTSGVKAALALGRKLRRDSRNKLYFEEREFNALGYRLMGEGRLDDAVAVFRFNVELYPSSGNVYDSLAEAYLNKGEIKMAIRNYETSLKLDPRNKNAEEKLRELRK